MDNKPLSHLDPKMQERYAQIMGRTSNASENNSVNPVGEETNNATFENVPNTAGGQSIDIQPTETLPQPEPFTPNPSPVPEANEAVQAPTDSPFFTHSDMSAEETPTPVAETYRNNQIASETLPTTNEPETTFSPDAPVTQYGTDTPPPSNISNPSEASAFSKPLTPPADLAKNGPKETSALLKVLYIVGAVIFFMIYTIFWIKVFNIPFLF